jgi:uncharacterized membrane protein YgdD (TMEM256/DUF423 family)
MLRWGLSILGVGLLFLLVFASLEKAGVVYFGSCGPSLGAVPLLFVCMLALPIGGVLTLIGLIQLAINRFRHRKDNAIIPRITPI